MRCMREVEGAVHGRRMEEPSVGPGAPGTARVRFLLDGMLPSAAARHLCDEFGRDALHVGELAWQARLMLRSLLYLGQHWPWLIRVSSVRRPRCGSIVDAKRAPLRVMHGHGPHGACGWKPDLKTAKRSAISSQSSAWVWKLSA